MRPFGLQDGFVLKRSSRLSPITEIRCRSLFNSFIKTSRFPLVSHSFSNNFFCRTIRTRTLSRKRYFGRKYIKFVQGSWGITEVTRYRTENPTAVGPRSVARKSLKRDVDLEKLEKPDENRGFGRRNERTCGFLLRRVPRPFGTAGSCDLHRLQTPVVRQRTDSPAPSYTRLDTSRNTGGKSISTTRRFRNVCALVDEPVVGNVAAGRGRLKTVKFRIVRTENGEKKSSSYDARRSSFTD